jgi:adenylate cyclase
VTARGRTDPLRLRDWLVAAAAALIVAAAVAAFIAPRIAGFSIDLSFWLRHHLMPRPAPPAQSAVAVVAIDEETYHTPSFRDYPSAAWTKQLAGVLNALIAADAAVVGFDVIFATSIDPLSPGWDREFLVALRAAARSGKVVLGEVQHQQFPIHPFAAQIFAVGGERNIRSVNLFLDRDGVIRRVPLSFERETGGAAATEPSMPVELARRAAGAGFDGNAVPGAAQNAMLLNFADSGMPTTYSLADLDACAREGRSDFFREHFAGKVVLIGVVLDVEDRKLASNRYITGPEHASDGERCVLPPRHDLFRADLVRDITPGIYLHATAVANLLGGDALREIDPLAASAILVAAALGAAVLALRLPPWLAGAALLAGTAFWILVAIAAFRATLVVPLLAPPLAAGLAMAVLLGYRIGVTDRARLLLRSSFALYLGPALIERMVDSDRLPELGGEERRITILISDVAGFTALSERLPPGELVALMNRYLTAMTEIIEGEGGYVDKFVGDAIVALFGAPLEEPRHALHAARAALRCRERLAELNGGADFQGHRLAARIGLSTGPALVGNVGARGRRLNYTALGDTVNLAARLESANKVYGTAILATEATRADAGDAVLWREIDRVRVVGRAEPVTLFEPCPPERAEVAAGYAAALAEYRAGRFAAALPLFERLAAGDPPSRIFAARTRGFMAAPPPSWDGVMQFEEK